MEDGELAATQLDSVFGVTGCEEHRLLLDDFGAAVHELLRLHQDQFAAIVQGDEDSSRFDLLIHLANERKQQAKYAYLEHVESHGCASLDASEARASGGNRRSA